MGKHTLDTELDTPSADYFLNQYGTPAMTEAEYSRAYADRRQFAAHLPATYASWRFDDLRHEYREAAWEAEPNALYREAEVSTMSNSDGWAPNRARFIIKEAYATNELVDWAREQGIHYDTNPRPARRD